MSEMTAGDLTAAHLGRMVTIESAGTTITGQLRAFHVDTDWIAERSLDQHPDDAEQVPGRRTLTVSVGRWTTNDLPLGAKVSAP